MAGSKTKYSFGESHMTIDAGGYHLYTRQFSVGSGSVTPILARNDSNQLLQSACKVRMKVNTGGEVYIGGSGTVDVNSGYLVGTTPEDFPITGASPGLYAVSNTSAVVSVIYFLPGPE